MKLIAFFKSIIKIEINFFIVLSFLLFTTSTRINAHKINEYKFIHVQESGNIFGIEERLNKYFKGIGFELVASYEIEDMSSFDKSRLLIATYKYEIVYGGSSPIVLTLRDIAGKTIYVVSGQGISFSAKGDMKNALKKIFMKLDALHYVYNPNKSRSETDNIGTKFTTWTEDSIKSYLNGKSTASIEGIYKNYTNELPYYKIAILKDDNQYVGMILEAEDSRWEKGGIKMSFRHISNDIYDIDYYDYWGKKMHATGHFKHRILEVIAKEFDKEEVLRFVKLYPTGLFNDVDNTQVASEVNLKATGSGFVVSGNVVATNYHVIENAENIKIGLKVGGSLEFYNARILLTDKTNDLALLIIKDEKYKFLNSVPYSIISNSVDVGTSVFTMGYPMSDVLGEEVKITDGLVSSKTGYEGDIVTYQISVPIQPGNSGGALFDKKGHLIGVTNAGIPSAENIGYAIKSSYLLNLIDSAPIDIPLSTGMDLKTKELTEIIKEFTPYIAFIKIY